MASLLSLLPENRATIYHLLGAIHFRCIDTTQAWKRSLPNRPPDTFFHEIHSLLLTCRTIYDELSFIVFTENQFHVRAGLASDLDFIKQLRSGTIPRLRNLVVDFRASVYGEMFLRLKCGSHRSGMGSSNTIRDQDKSDDDRKRVDERVFVAWDESVEHLNRHLPSSSLGLSLIHDSKDLEEAERVVQPLIAHELKLTACSIRLSSHHDKAMQRLAERIVSRTTEQSESIRSFNFLGLPSEIRMKILSYTDLVHPLREVNWRMSTKYLERYHEDCSEKADRIKYRNMYWRGNLEQYWSSSIFNDQKQQLDAHYICQFRHCSNVHSCDGRVDLFRRAEVDAHLGVYDGQISARKCAGCFCERYHAAAAFPVICKCWAPPTSMFLVCKTMKKESEAVFFANNRIILFPDQDWWHLDDDDVLEGLSPSVYLHLMPPYALSQLRQLEIVLPPFDQDYCLEDSSNHTDWVAAASRAARYINAPNLYVRIIMADDSESRRERGFLPRYRESMTRECGEQIIATYKRILTPLKPWLDLGLKKLELDLAWPWAHSSDPPDDGTKAKELGDSIGKWLLGEDAWERMKGHHQEQRRSQWTMDCAHFI